MAQTYAQGGLTPQLWDDKFFREYVRTNRFKKYMGTDENSIIQLKDDLTKKKGDSVTFALLSELQGSGRTGNQTLKGYEERLGLYSHKLTVNVLRHAVAVDDWDEQKSTIALRDAAKVALKEWALKKMRDGIVDAMSGIDGVAYASATAAQKNTWNANNSDRVLYGSAVSNYNATHATALANIDATNDKLTTGLISLAKRLAQTATPKIAPVNVKEDEEWYVWFAQPRAFRDLAASTTMQQANRDARARGIDNPLFTGGALVWDGVIIREIPELPVIAGAGAAGIDVAANFLCGAQAMGVAWAQRTKTTTDTDDYDFLHGVGIQEIRGIEKLRFNNQDNGIFTVFTAAVADA